MGFDVPGASRISYHRLAGESMTDLDKEFYRASENFQISKPLPDGFLRQTLANGQELWRIRCRIGPARQDVQVIV